LVYFGGRTDTQAFASVQQHDAIGEFCSEIQLMRYDNHGIVMLVREPAKAAQQFDLAADVEVLGGLVQKEQ